MCVCSLNYPACKAHAPCYIDVWGFSTFLAFFDISYTRRFSERRLSQICEKRHYLRDVCQSVRPSVRPSVHPHGTTRLPVDGIHEIWYLSIFGKYVEKIQVSSKSDKNNGYFTWRRNTYLIISRSILIRIRNISGKSLEKIKTHILCSITFFFSKIVSIMR